jgi:hypothetical protein
MKIYDTVPLGIIADLTDHRTVRSGGAALVLEQKLSLTSSMSLIFFSLVVNWPIDLLLTIRLLMRRGRFSFLWICVFFSSDGPVCYLSH